MVLKVGVRLKDLSPQVVLALLVAERLWNEAGAELVITSINDGKHKVGSFHYKGQAVDLRTKNLPPDLKSTTVDKLKGNLGKDFDVLFEDVGGLNEHCHVEYDPK